MLKPRLLVMLLAISSALPQQLKKDTRLGKKPPFPKQTDCETVKCPAVEQPICAKLVYKNAGNQTVYVVMVNKCEMNYVKCHEGLEAVVVPMKNCGHDHLVNSGSKRSKRAIEDIPLIEQLILKVDDENEQFKLRGDEDEAEPVAGSGDIKDDEAENGSDYKDEAEEGNEDDETEMEANDGDNFYSYEYADGEYNGVQEYYAEEVPSEEYEYVEDYGANYIYYDTNEYVNGKEKLSGGFRVDLDGALNAQYSEVNENEYYSDCPTVCPSRDVMVCARCQHGVFRTFLTICHMRMFGCRHTDESLELISRLPCVNSAPYLPDVSMQPTGRVLEPGDDDRVLRFIRCREKTQMSRERDSRCNFADHTKLMMQKDTVDDDY